MTNISQIIALSQDESYQQYSILTTRTLQFKGRALTNHVHYQISKADSDIPPEQPIISNGFSTEKTPSKLVEFRIKDKLVKIKDTLSPYLPSSPYKNSRMLFRSTKIVKTKNLTLNRLARLQSTQKQINKRKKNLLKLLLRWAQKINLPSEQLKQVKKISNKCSISELRAISKFIKTRSSFSQFYPKNKQEHFVTAKNTGKLSRLLSFINFQPTIKQKETQIDNTECSLKGEDNKLDQQNKTAEEE